MNKRRYKGFDYEARNPAPPAEVPGPELPRAKVTSKRKAVKK